MKISISTILRSAREQVDLARQAERLGVWSMGIPDTQPLLYQGMYPTATAALLATQRLRIGPMVTNPVLSHWAVHAANAKALQELAPNRFFLGIATGDGAVHAVGLQPAKLETLEGYLKAMAPHWPGLDILVAASGPRGAELAGRNATDLLIGTGLDATALSNLAGRARAARRAAGVAAPLRIWMSCSTCVLETESQLAQARAAVQGACNGSSRYTFSSGFAEKNVPQELQAPMLERLRRYDVGSHAVTGDNPNSALFADRPDIQEYLLGRMPLIGTAEQCVARAHEVATAAGLDGVRMVLSSWQGVGGGAAQLERLAPLLGDFTR